ncbi:MAG: DUF2752 domain-containing protein [Ginsengibacter sp.]
MKKNFHKYFEITAWLMALVMLAAMNTAERGFTLCLFKMAGFSWCPGCGLAHSMAYAIHGEIAASIKTHWFGIPAMLIIVNRVIVLAKMNLRTRKCLYYGL